MSVNNSWNWYQPLINGYAVAISLAIKLVSFTRQVHQDRRRFKNRDWLTIWPISIRGSRHAVVYGNF